MARILIGIPAHDEEEHIFDVATACEKYGHVLVLDNGSTDYTEREALKTTAAVETYSESGYGFALSKIFDWARCFDYDYLITLDGDGQHNPDEIPAFLEALKSSDVVIGNRFIKSDETPIHRKAVILAINTIMGFGDTQCGFRGYSRKAIEHMKIAEMGMGASIEILNRALALNLTISEVPCSITYETSNSPTKVISQGMNLVETIFWNTVWSRPYTFLGVPAAFLVFTSSIFGLMLLNFYATERVIIPSILFLCALTALAALLLVIFAFFITISRRIIKELSAK